MRTSAIVALICLAMGVAPSFSLPSISVRANLSKRSAPPHGQGSPPRARAHRHVFLRGNPGHWRIMSSDGTIYPEFPVPHGWTPPGPGYAVPLDWTPPVVDGNVNGLHERGAPNKL
ncbi:hypothetical protein F5148DRAFT_1202854 [Russula earlei]|uniref:Uncharacterized protein n=1 Tax=Russula earlei TaxID=71964 RepID=A0ACC0U7S0_9AGAM|nr:hypothetical protein F5148DRAFT_1202854 [Russula earlei]